MKNWLNVINTEFKDFKPAHRGVINMDEIWTLRKMFDIHLMNDVNELRNLRNFVCMYDSVYTEFISVSEDFDFADKISALTSVIDDRINSLE